MNNELFTRYKEIKERIASLEKEKAELELEMFDEFDSNGTNSYTFSGYSYFRMGRKSWEYSPTLQAKATELSKQKKIEELEGIATLKKESQYIRVVASKKENV